MQVLVNPRVSGADPGSCWGARAPRRYREPTLISTAWAAHLPRCRGMRLLKAKAPEVLVSVRSESVAVRVCCH